MAALKPHFTVCGLFFHCLRNLLEIYADEVEPMAGIVESTLDFKAKIHDFIGNFN